MSDPTRTLTLRRDFERDLGRRSRRLRGLVRQTVGYDVDALGLSGNADPPEPFPFESRDDLRDAFMDWFEDAVRDELLDPVPPQEVQAGSHWTAAYIRAAYRKGWQFATRVLRDEGMDVRTADVGASVEGVFDLPVPRRQLRKLYTRAFTNLRDITDDAAQVIRSELTKGLNNGENPRKIASRLSKELRTIENTRLRTLARTEIINSHSDATLDRYEEMGVETVGHGEWKTADDDRVCPICKALDGRVFTIGEMRSRAFSIDGTTYNLKPPAHPNGRCVILPKLDIAATDLGGFDERAPSADEITANAPVLTCP